MSMSSCSNPPSEIFTLFCIRLQEQWHVRSHARMRASAHTHSATCRQKTHETKLIHTPSIPLSHHDPGHTIRHLFPAHTSSSLSSHCTHSITTNTSAPITTFAPPHWKTQVQNFRKQNIQNHQIKIQILLTYALKRYVCTSVHALYHTLTETQINAQDKCIIQNIHQRYQTLGKALFSDSSCANLSLQFRTMRGKKYLHTTNHFFAVGERISITSTYCESLLCCP